MKNALLYALTIGTITAVAVVAHLLAAVDWPWAIAAGAAAAVVLRGVIEWRSTGSHRNIPLRP